MCKERNIPVSGTQLSLAAVLQGSGAIKKNLRLIGRISRLRRRDGGSFVPLIAGLIKKLFNKIIGVRS